MDKKNILVIGSGGREHAICWKLKMSERVGKIYCIPGNAGISSIATCVPNIKVTEFDKIIDFLREKGDIYMTVVAPDEPLSLGLVDRLESEGFRAFGPNARAAEIESSKVFSKGFMQKYGIPTAKFVVFEDYKTALDFVNCANYPLAVKADGLALGKGAIMCYNKEDGINAVKLIMQDGAFGKSGARIVVEEFLKGFEVSVLAFCDGKTLRVMASSQDHKRALDGDKGLNTGGMGTFSPSFRFTKELEKRAYDTIFMPTVKALEKEGRAFKGVLYFGLMVDGEDINVVEYNARFGDPETQVILPRMENDILDVFDACIDGTLDKIDLRYLDSACVCVILASRGYPENAEKGKLITIDKLENDCMLFHAGTAFDSNGKLITSGGRVLGVTALGESLAKARERAYRGVTCVEFDGMQYRTDICKL